MFKLIKNNLNYLFFYAWICILELWVGTSKGRILPEFTRIYQESAARFGDRLFCIFNDIHNDFFYIAIFAIAIAGFFYIKERLLIKLSLIIASVIGFIIIHIWNSLSIGCL